MSDFKQWYNGLPDAIDWDTWEHCAAAAWQACDAWNAEKITALRAQVARLEGALRESYEVYAGMDGFTPETAAEGYCLRIIDEMAKPLAKALQPAS
jgi:hypothetical protein